MGRVHAEPIRHSRKFQNRGRRFLQQANFSRKQKRQRGKAKFLAAQQEAAEKRPDAAVVRDRSKIPEKEGRVTVPPSDQDNGNAKKRKSPISLALLST